MGWGLCPCWKFPTTLPFPSLAPLRTLPLLLVVAAAVVVVVVAAVAGVRVGGKERGVMCPTFPPSQILPCFHQAPPPPPLPPLLLLLLLLVVFATLSPPPYPSPQTPPCT